MTETHCIKALLSCVGLAVAAAAAGPYAGALDDAENPYDPGVPGWVGPAGDGYADVQPWYPNPGNVINPAFTAWADSVVDYAAPGGVDPGWDDPSYALGPATGDEMDIVSLGEMTAARIAAWLADPTNPANPAPGSITLGFAEKIHDGPGPDLAVFENGFASSGSASFFAELAYVEVSSDGATFARFPSVSLTAAPGGGDTRYLAISATDVYNLAGKHANAHGRCWGTPFDLADLADAPAVVAGRVDLDAIRYVRIVDVPGDGSFADSRGEPIYDGWPTYGSGGFDLDAVGALHTGDKPAVGGDANGDGHVDIQDFVVLKVHYGQAGAAWSDGDFNGDGAVDIADFVILKQNYGR